MKSYNSSEEIKKDLKRLKLERQIAWEEMKGLRYKVKEDLQAYSWLNMALSVAKKYGMLYLIRKLFK